MQLEDTAVEYAASKLHQVKKSRGLPTLSATFLHGNIFKEHWCEQLGGPFDCVHVGGSCSKNRIQDLMLLVKQGTLGRSCALKLPVKKFAASKAHTHAQGLDARCMMPLNAA